MNRAATVALTPVSFIYDIVVRARNIFYRSGFFRSRQVGVPVISIGNLTSGGTGKTPLVEWTARALSSLGLRVCVLTRGYGRENPNQRVIASDGTELLAQVAETGDEAFMLAERLKGEAAVVCDSDRVSAAHWAIEHLGSEVLVLDDAFQHQRIARDLNILAVDATNPWGNGYSLPAGILREPIHELSRADCVIITRADADNSARLQHEISKIHPGVPIVLSRMKQTELRKLGTNSSLPNSREIKASRVAAFCGIGNPESFFNLLRTSGYTLNYQQIFRDHHNFTQADVDQFIRAAQSHGALAVLTTVKDAVKARSLNFSLPCYVAEIEIEFDNEELLRKLILRTIGRE